MKRLWAVAFATLLLFTSCGKVQFVEEEEVEDNQEEELILLEKPEGSNEVQLIGGDQKEKLHQEKEYMVEVESLNLRKTPDRDGEIITTLREGEILRILEIQDSWAKVEVEDLKGYVAKKYLKELEEPSSAVDEERPQDDENQNEEEQNPPSSKKTMICDVDVLNIRSFASEDAEIRGTLERGDEVEIIMDTDLTRNQWVKIKFGELRGYVVKEYLK